MQKFKSIGAHKHVSYLHLLEGKNRGSLAQSISVKFNLSFSKMILGKLSPPVGFISAAHSPDEARLSE